jgi:hypothetical protein
VQPLYSARGRLIKRPRAISPVVEAISTDSCVKNDTFSSEPRRKRARKSSQLPQFDVYQDENFRADSTKYSGSQSLALSVTERQTEKIWPHISVEIPFHFKFHQNSSESSPTQVNRRPLAPLSSIALNEAQKAPKIPLNWLKNQPNNHTSTFFSLF